MSQIFKVTAGGGGIPPSVPQTFITQDGNAVPSANQLQINAYDSVEDNLNGITTKGGVAAGDPPGTGASNELDIYLTNRLQGTGTTVGVTTVDIITFTPPVIGTYSIGFDVAAFNTTSSLGSGYRLFGAVRFDGVNSTLCDAFEAIDEEEGTMSNVGLDVVVSGADVILQATGYAAQTINWASVGLYVFVGA